MTNTLTVSNLSKAFKEKTIFSNISLSFTGGKIYGIIGENGCGKTVFMKCLCGLLPADQGDIHLNDHKKEPPKGSFGVIIESPGFLPNFSGYANLKMLAALRRKVSRQEIYAALEEVGLKDVARKKVGKYSLGMRQRLGIAQALIDDPPILLLDEPLNGLDQSALQKTYDLILQMREKGKIIILASHHPEDIRRLCDEVFELASGQLIKKQS